MDPRSLLLATNGVLALAMLALLSFFDILEDYNSNYRRTQNHLIRALAETKISLSATANEIARSESFRTQISRSNSYALSQLLSSHTRYGIVDSLAIFDTSCDLVTQSSLRGEFRSPCQKDRNSTFQWQWESGRPILALQFGNPATPFILNASVELGNNWLQLYPDLARNAKGLGMHMGLPENINGSSLALYPPTSSAKNFSFYIARRFGAISIAQAEVLLRFRNHIILSLLLLLIVLQTLTFILYQQKRDSLSQEIANFRSWVDAILTNSLPEISRQRLEQALPQVSDWQDIYRSTIKLFCHFKKETDRFQQEKNELNHNLSEALEKSAEIQRNTVSIFRESATYRAISQQHQTTTAQANLTEILMLSNKFSYQSGPTTLATTLQGLEKFFTVKVDPDVQQIVLPPLGQGSWFDFAIAIGSRLACKDGSISVDVVDADGYRKLILSGHTDRSAELESELINTYCAEIIQFSSVTATTSSASENHLAIALHWQHISSDHSQKIFGEATLDTIPI